MTSGDAGPHGPHVMDVTFRNAGEITVSLRANGKWPVSRKESEAYGHTTASSSRGRGSRSAKTSSSALVSLHPADVRARTTAQVEVVAAAVGRRSNVG